MTSIPMGYLAQGDILGMLGYMFTSYIGYGLVWIILGILIFGIVHKTTRSYSIAGVIFVIYGTIASALLPQEVQPFFYILIAIIVVALLIRVLK